MYLDSINKQVSINIAELVAVFSKLKRQFVIIPMCIIQLVYFIVYFDLQILFQFLKTKLNLSASRCC